MEARKSGKNMDCDMMKTVAELGEGTRREWRGSGIGCERNGVGTSRKGSFRGIKVTLHLLEAREKAKSAKQRFQVYM